VKRSPLLGEHTDEILKEVHGFNDNQLPRFAAPVRWSRRARSKRPSKDGDM